MPAFNLFTQPPEPSHPNPAYQADQMTAIREYFDLSAINWDRLSSHAREQIIHAYYNDHSHRCQRTRMRMGL